MHFPGRGIKLVVRVNKAELEQHCARRDVVGIVTGKESVRAEHIERKIAHRARRLERKTAPPKRGTHVNAKLENIFARPKTATSDVRAALAKKHRPILNAVRALRFDFEREPCEDFFAGWRASVDVLCDLGITP